MFPRWLSIVLVLVALLWLIVDPAGFAAFLKGIGQSLITFVKGLA